MRLADSNQVLSEHLNRLLAGQDVARMELAKRMGVADGTLGRIKYGKANPTIDVVDKIARYFRVDPWDLLRPTSSKGHKVAEAQAVYHSADAAKLHRLVDELGEEQQRALVVLLSK